MKNSKGTAIAMAAITLLIITGVSWAEWTEDFESYPRDSILPHPWQLPWNINPSASMQNQITGGVSDTSGIPGDPNSAIGEGWSWSRAWRSITTENRVTAQLFLGGYMYAETAIGLTEDMRHDQGTNAAIAGNQTNINLYATGEPQNRLALMIGSDQTGEFIPGGPHMYFYAGGKRLTDDPVRDFAAVSYDTWYDVELEKDGLVCTARFKEAAGSTWTEWTYTLASEDDDFDIHYVCIQTRLGYAGVDNISTFDPEPAVCGDPGTVYKRSDANRDCSVNLLDVAVMAGEWLDCTDPEQANCGL